MMFWRKQSSGPQIPKKVETTILGGDDDIPRYPPFMKGLPVVSPSKLLESQRELLDRIANTAIATPEVFDRHYLGAIARFASFSHLLPASQSHHHRGAGGLLRHAIEVGLWALQSADRVLIKSAISAMHRRETEPRWQLAVFLAAMCHDAGKPVTDLIVTNKDRSSTWHPISDDLYSWARKAGVNAYFLEWREGRGKQHTALSSLIAERIIGAQSLSWIAEADTELVVWLMESLACNPSPTNLIHDLVIRADQTSVERDLKTMGVAMAGYDLGVPVERHLIDIMRRFVREGVWLVNEPGARLWNLEHNLYLVWPAGGEELARQIKEDAIPGMPRTPDGILDMLSDRGMAFVRSDAHDHDRLWRIAPAILAEKIPEIKLAAIQLRDDALVSSVPLARVPGMVFAAMPGIDLANDADAPLVNPESVDQISTQKPTPDRSIAAESGTAGDSGQPLSGQKSKPHPFSKTNAIADTKSSILVRDAEQRIPLDGTIGEVLNALAQEIKSAVKTWGIHAHADTDGEVYLRWQDAFVGFGLSAKTILEHLMDRDWLVIDPMSPLKRTTIWKFSDGEHAALRLEHGVSKAFLEQVGQLGNTNHTLSKGYVPFIAKPTTDQPEERVSQKKLSTPLVSPPESQVLQSKKKGTSHVSRNGSANTDATIEQFLAILRAQAISPELDGYCLISQLEAMKLCKLAGVKVNHRIVWKFDALNSGLMNVVDDCVRFKP